MINPCVASLPALAAKIVWNETRPRWPRSHAIPVMKANKSATPFF